jgi:hypothetical protein
MSFSIKQSGRTLLETARLDFQKVSSWGHNINDFLASKGFSASKRKLLYATTALAGAGFIYSSPIQALGFAALGFLQLAPFMRDNKNKRGNTFLGCLLLSPQMILLGDYVGALQTGVAGTRAQFMNIVDDESYKTRIGISALFWAGAMGVSYNFGLIKSAIDVLPLAAMTCGTLADACPDKMTHIARILRITGASALSPHRAFVSGSLAGLAAEVIGGINLARTAVQNDVPVKDSNGSPLTLRDQFHGWVQSLKTMQRIEPYMAGRPDPLIQAASYAVSRIKKSLP